MLKFLDIFFVIFHSSFIIFNIIGWIWKKLRVWNLVTLLLTGGSWFILGMIVGTPGYCPLTDWHFSILGKLGRRDLPSSYVKYLADRLTGIDFDPRFIDSITIWMFTGALVISVLLNLKDFSDRRKGLR